MMVHWKARKKPNCLNLHQKPLQLLITNWLNVCKQISAAIQNRDGFAAILLTLLKLKYKGDNFKKHLASLLIWPGFLFKRRKRRAKGQIISE